jgi:hypothetical protein
MATPVERDEPIRVLSGSTEAAYGQPVEILLLGPVAVRRKGADVRLRTVLALVAAHAGSDARGVAVDLLVFVQARRLP